MLHWLLLTTIAWMTSTNTTPIQSLSRHLSKLIHPIPSSNLHIIKHQNQPRFREEPIIAHHTHKSSARHLLQETINVTAECEASEKAADTGVLAANLTRWLAENLDSAVWSFYQNDGDLNQIREDLIFGTTERAVLEAGCDVSMVRINPLRERLTQLLTDGAQIVECGAVFGAFTITYPFGYRRRLKLSHRATAEDMLNMAPEVEVAADFTDEWTDFFRGIYSAVAWDLTASEDAAVERDIFPGSLMFIAFRVAISEALTAAIDAGCMAEGPGPDVLSVISETLATTRLLFGSEVIGSLGTTTMTPVDGEGADDDDDSDSSSEENSAKSEVQVQDDFDMDRGIEGEEEVDDDNGLKEEVTLRIATSTMTNLWIGLIVFCGFNLCLCWCLMVRSKKESVHYETAEEPPSISVNLYE